MTLIPLLGSNRRLFYSTVLILLNYSGSVNLQISILRSLFYLSKNLQLGMMIYIQCHRNNHVSQQHIYYINIYKIRKIKIYVLTFNPNLLTHPNLIAMLFHANWFQSFSATSALFSLAYSWITSPRKANKHFSGSFKSSMSWFGAITSIELSSYSNIGISFLIIICILPCCLIWAVLQLFFSPVLPVSSSVGSAITKILFCTAHFDFSGQC